MNPPAFSWGGRVGSKAGQAAVGMCFHQVFFSLQRGNYSWIRQDNRGHERSSWMQICWAYRGNSVRLSQLGDQLVADFRQFFDFLVLKNKQWDDALYVPRWKDYGEIVLRLPIPSLGTWLDGSSLFCIRNPFKESFLLVASVVSNFLWCRGL